jgi:hypothetical protein
MGLYLHDDSGNVVLSYGLEVTLTTEWRPYSFRLTEFKAVNPAAKGTAIAPGKITSFTIDGSSTSSQTLELQIDTLRVESSRAQK